MTAVNQSIRTRILAPHECLGRAGNAIRLCAIDSKGDDRVLVAGRELREIDLKTGSMSVTRAMPLNNGISGRSLSRDGRTLFWSADQLLVHSGRDGFVSTASQGTDSRHFDAAAILSHLRLAVATRDAQGQPWLQVFAALSMSSSARLSRQRPDRTLWMETFSNDGLVNGRADGTIELWLVPELTAAPSLIELTGHAGPVVRGVVTPDDRLLVTAGADLTVRVWPLPQSSVLQASNSVVCEGHSDQITDLAVTPDGRCAVTSSRDHTIRLWSLPDGRSLGVLAEHRDWVTHVALHPSGTHLASSSEDGSIKVWHLASRQCIGTAYINSRCLCLAVSGPVVCASDAAGNFWMLEYYTLTVTP